MNLLKFLFAFGIGFTSSADLLLSGNKFTNSSSAYYFASTNTTWDSSKAVDGNMDGVIYNGHCFSSYSSNDKWWLVVLDGVYVVTRIIIYARTDCCTSRLSTLSLYASYDSISQVTSGSSSFYEFQYYQGPPAPGISVVSFNFTRLVARTVMVAQEISSTSLELCEFKVYGHQFYHPNPMIYTLKPSLYVNASAILTTKTMSVVKCSKICLETVNCVSFTLTSNGTCEIFSHAGGVYSMIPE